jgi:hypothetical protein
MSIDVTNHQRRRFLGAAAIAAAAAQLGLARPARAAGTSAAGPGGFPNPLKQVRTDALEIGYAELGEAGQPAVILLHGWPYDIHSFVDAASLLAPR